MVKKKKEKNSSIFTMTRKAVYCIIFVFTLVERGRIGRIEK